MPLMKEWEPDAHSLAAIWKIGEPEDFFILATGLESALKSDKRRIERLAGRYLLQHLKEDFPLHHIAPDKQDKPRIPDNRYFFSISHSYPYIAAMVSDRKECGMDIQVWHHRMEVLQHKFLSPEEQALFDNDTRQLTLAWCVKEAAYKWLGRRGIDFIEQLPIVATRAAIAEGNFSIRLNPENGAHLLDIKGSLEDDFAIAYSI